MGLTYERKRGLQKMIYNKKLKTLKGQTKDLVFSILVRYINFYL